jgi:uncharacterized paraquat-inducible protein A
MGTPGMLAAVSMLLFSAVCVVLAGIVFLVTIALLLTWGAADGEPQALPMIFAYLLSLFGYFAPRGRLVIFSTAVALAVVTLVGTRLLRLEADMLAVGMFAGVISHGLGLFAFLLYQGFDRIIKAAEEEAEWERDARCKECGYDLRGLRKHRCPECGTWFKVIRSCELDEDA